MILIRHAAALAILMGTGLAQPVAVRHPRGYIHGFLLIRDSANKVIGSGDLVQRPAGNRINSVMTLHFKDGSLYKESVVFAQRRSFQLISYQQFQRGPSFKEPLTMSFDTASGNVTIAYTNKQGSEKTITEHVDMAPDVANGLLPTLITEINPKVETTLSMIVSTPKPRLVKLKITGGPEEQFTIGGRPNRAVDFTVKVDIGGIAGVAAKVAGKQPEPIHLWVAAGDAPMFLRSEGQLYEDGPIWQIELTSPVWPRAKPASR